MRLIVFFLLCTQLSLAQEIHFRYNQLGYLPTDKKVALIMADTPLTNSVYVSHAASDATVLRVPLLAVSGQTWGDYPHQYIVDFSELQQPGRYLLSYDGARSTAVTIDSRVYHGPQETLLSFMRQQRCGYNPYFDVVCHQRDGRLFYAPVPDSTYGDFSGGWHDAGDQLKYLITSSNATARLLMAYEKAPEQFGDRVDAYGQDGPNGIPDILDEAKWGLDWLLKLHPRPDWLIHQIADDRDHRGFKFPHRDNADYGWGENSYRPAYFATGTPQGLGKWKSQATGVANLAGRTAAALALGARIWYTAGLDPTFAERCREAAIELYDLGRRREGYQQGNSYGAPYRYNELTWTDDMEWGAAELYKLTRRPGYLEQAVHYAYQTRDEGWMSRDSMSHYELYPFMNMGHYALYPVAPDSVQRDLARWYRKNIERVFVRSRGNAFEFGVPFIWCSNNLLVNFLTQVLLYEEMTGDHRFHLIMLLHRDWLFGRNPWGTSMFTGIPQDGEYPLDVHIPGRALLGDTAPGGLVDGPVYRSIFDKLLGLTLQEPDEFAAFQNDHVVYHDDIGDYSTNEPTMDGTADAILLWALWLKE